MIKKSWFGVEFKTLWRVLAAAAIFGSLFTYDQIFRQEREHLITINGVPFLLPPWSVSYAPYDAKGPVAFIFTYGILPDFNTWREEYKLVRNTLDPNYVQILIRPPLSNGNAVVNNIKQRTVAEVFPNQAPVNVEELSLRKYESPTYDTAYYVPTQSFGEPLILNCPKPDLVSRHPGLRCEANIDRDKYTLEIRFLPSELPRWKEIVTKVLAHVEELRARGDAALAAKN